MLWSAGLPHLRGRIGTEPATGPEDSDPLATWGSFWTCLGAVTGVETWLYTGAFAHDAAGNETACGPFCHCSWLLEAADEADVIFAELTFIGLGSGEAIVGTDSGLVT